MLKLAVTGSMGSGKTRICSVLISQGIPVFSCDSLVKKLQSPENSLWMRIKEKWGSKYIGGDGSLDRKKLAEDVLESEDIRNDISNISHPLVRNELEKVFAAWESENHKLAAAEVPLLYEAGWEDLFDKVMAAWAPREVLLKRIMEKRACGRKEAGRWLELQMPQNYKKEKADYAVNTGGKWEETEDEVVRIIRRIQGGELNENR